MKVRPVRLLEATAIALFVFSLGWWLIVYGQVIFNTGMSPSSAVPCLLYTSDRCSLAMALCKDWHFLGIKRYFAEPIWFALALSAAVLFLGRGSARSR